MDILITTNLQEPFPLPSACSCSLMQVSTLWRNAAVTPVTFERDPTTALDVHTAQALVDKNTGSRGANRHSASLGHAAHARKRWTRLLPVTLILRIPSFRIDPPTFFLRSTLMVVKIVLACFYRLSAKFSRRWINSQPFGVQPPIFERARDG